MSIVYLNGYGTATRERYHAGAIAALELNSIKIGYGQARQQLLVAKNSYQKSLLNLKLLLGKPGDEELNIEGKAILQKITDKYRRPFGFSIWKETRLEGDRDREGEGLSGNITP